MRIAIVAERPFLLDAFAPLLPEFFPGADFSRAAVFYPILSWYTQNRFLLLRGLKWSDLPFTGQTRYRPISALEARPMRGVRELTGPPVPMSEAEAVQALADADIILVIMDPSYIGAHLAFRFLTDILGHLPPGRVLYPWATSLTTESLRTALTGMQAFDAFAMGRVAEGEIRRYFDYNYLANALPILGETARRAEMGTDGIPSKYGLQLLYHVRATGEMADGARISLMYKWRGTGKYVNGGAGLGSATSRPRIIEDLLAGNFLRRTASGRRSATDLSAAGRRFLDLLHPGCEDSDLPFRIEKWSLQPEPEAKAGIDRYIRTFFGRQKKLLGRMS